MNIFKFILALILALPKIFWMTVVLPTLAYFKAWKLG